MDGKSFLKNGRNSCGVLIKLNINFCARKDAHVDLERSEFFFDFNFPVADAKCLCSHRQSIEIVDEFLET